MKHKRVLLCLPDPDRSLVAGAARDGARPGRGPERVDLGSFRRARGVGARGRWLAVGRVILAVLGLALGGCRVAEETARLPVQMVSAVVPGRQPPPGEPATLQAELQRSTDDFTSRVVAGLEEYVRRSNTSEARTQALRWRLSLASSALTIATGPNPKANLLDFVALASLNRAFVEDLARNARPPGAFDPWLQSSRILETNAWKLTGKVLTPEQQSELRAAIDRWRAEEAPTGDAFFSRAHEFGFAIRQAGESKASASSVFSLVGLDPTAGLDPAVREVTRTRLFAERALYAMQHLPFIVRWQTEMLAEGLLRQPEVTNLVASTDRLSRAAESATRTAGELPDRVTAERKAILEALEAQEGRLRELAAEVGQTLAAGEAMSTSLNSTIQTFDALMKRFGVGEPARGPRDTNAPPFNILDYARTAEQIATMSRELDTVIRDLTGTLDSPALDRRLVDLRALTAQARADARSVLNHAFLLAAGLILLTFTCAFVYRRLR